MKLIKVAIMKRVKSLFINTFSIKDDNIAVKSKPVSEAFDLHPYNDDVGYGFTNFGLSYNILSASFLRRIPSYIQDYDENNKTLVKRNIFIFSSISFSIDFEMNLILVEGGAAQMNSLKSIFRNVFNFSYDIDTVGISPTMLYQKIQGNSTKFLVNHLTIRAFNFNNGIVGRFSGEVIKQTVIPEIMELYQSEITKISFNIAIENDEWLTLQAFPNGSLKFLSSQEDLSYYISYIKTLIFS